MAAYATVPPGDPFAASKAVFAALADELAGPAVAGLTACELEEFIDEESRRVVLQLLQDHYDLRALREEQRAGKHPAPVAGTDGITRTRLETGHAIHLAMLSADCKGIVMRPGALRAATAKAAAELGKMRTRLTAGEKPNRKRMAALVTVYDAEPAPRRPHDVIAPPGGRDGSRPLRPGPNGWPGPSARTPRT
jgi:hypothetical protein